MSIRIMTLVWDKGPENERDMLVLLALSDNANDDGVCWPSMNTVARKCRMTRQGIVGIIERLESDGWIKVYRSSSDGVKNVNRYFIQFERFNRQGVVNPVDYVVNPVDKGSKPGLLKPSINLNNKKDIFQIYEEEIGVISPKVSDSLQEAEKTYPREWIEEVIEIAAKANKRNWAYCDAILKTWKANGHRTYKDRKQSEKPYIPEDHATEVYQ